MRKEVAVIYLTAIVCAGLFSISGTVTAQNSSSPTNFTNSSQMNKTSEQSNFTDLTNTSANGNVSENINGTFNTTQANNAMMSND